MTANKQFWVLTYKEANGLLKPGERKAINCNHQRIQDCGINMVGEIVPLPGATYPPGDADAPSGKNASVMVPQGTVFPSPTQYPDTDFKAVTRIKDMVTLLPYWVDTASYNANVVTCNS